MTTNESLSDQIAEKIIKKVKTGNGVKRRSTTSVPVQTEVTMIKHYIAYYNYVTEHYKWTASQAFTTNGEEQPEYAARKAIEQKRGASGYELLYVREA